MTLRLLHNVFYITPAIIAWDDETEDSYSITASIAWLCWSLEFTIRAVHG
ncbi:hypothetical protein AAKU67_002206 [Oxalobacteraceae bacterium GrIS 2.11]